MKTDQLTTMLVVALLTVCLFIAHFIYQKLYAKIKAQAKEELIAEGIAEEAAANFYAVNADIRQHLKDDDIIKPKSGSEEHYQRWKAERESQEG